MAEGKTKSDSGASTHKAAKESAMTNDAQWVEDVKRWYFGRSRSSTDAAADGLDDDVAIGYEAAHPALQARHWPDAPLTTDR